MTEQRGSRFALAGLLSEPGLFLASFALSTPRWGHNRRRTRLPNYLNHSRVTLASSWLGLLVQNRQAAQWIHASRLRLFPLQRDCSAQETKGVGTQSARLGNTWQEI
ncbi:hypothetical protein HC256_004572 [Beauveria bassiana]|nr:hypothetical protein HC256_004572 [Beauveria bassiana]